MPLSQYRREFSTFLDVVVAVLAYVVTVQWHLGGFARSTNLWYVEMAPTVVAVWWILSLVIRQDVPYRLGGTWRELQETILLNGVGAILLLALNLATKHDAVSRLILVGFPALAAITSTAIRFTLRAWLGWRRRAGHDVHHVLLAGPADPVRQLATSLLHRDAGLLPLGVLLPPDAGSDVDKSLPVLGDYHRLADVLHTRVVDQVAFAMPLDDGDLRPMIETCLREGKSVWLATDAFGSRLLGNRPDQLLVLSVPRDAVGVTLKRVLDIGLAGAALLVAVPLLVVCALAVCLDDPTGPPIFRQRRVGLHGREFTVYKFRSMGTDAEQRRAALQERNEMSGPVFKIRDDPRITRVGRFLRRYSLDELPQLWNVLRGDMSLVGPRPSLPDEVRQYEPEFRRRLACRPGLTCLWQVSGRNAVDFRTWMELDLQYVDNWSLALDLRILMRTIPTVFKGSGM